MCTFNLVKVFDIWLEEEPYEFRNVKPDAYMIVLLLSHPESNNEIIKCLTIFEPICLTMQSIWILWPAWKWESLNFCQASLILRILLFENLDNLLFTTKKQLWNCKRKCVCLSVQLSWKLNWLSVWHQAESAVH